MKYQPKLQFSDKYNIKEKTINEIEDLIVKIDIDQNFIDSLYNDPRKTTTKLAIKCEKLLKKQKMLKNEVKEYKLIEKQLYNKGYNNIYGFYAAGIYAAAGPITCVLLLLNKYFNNFEIKYSNELADKLKYKLYDILIKEAKYYDIYQVSAEKVDELGIKESIIYGYNKLYSKIEDKDENYYIYYKYGKKQKDSRIIKSTKKKEYILAAASIVAKVEREIKMEELADKYKDYDFKHNYGYNTYKHRDIVRKKGFSPIHRKSFDFEKKLKLEF